MFCSLSCYQVMEKDVARGDTDEGVLRYQSEGKLKITKTESGEKRLLDSYFRSEVKTEQILVFCMSTKFSKELASEFDTDCCVEVRSLGVLLGAVRKKLKFSKEFKGYKLRFGHVEYKAKEQFDGTEWAIPEKLIFRKNSSFSYQLEYRIAIGPSSVFDIENVGLNIVSNETEFRGAEKESSRTFMELGKIDRKCNVFRFT